MEYDWEALLAADKAYTDDELIKDLDRINQETNKERKHNLLSTKAAKFSYNEKLNENQFLERLNTTELIFKTYDNHKFPQANNINLAFILIEYLLEYSTGNYQYITSTGLSLEMGFSGRQGSYYGDLLHYLGFLDKKELDIAQPRNYLTLKALTKKGN